MRNNFRMLLLSIATFGFFSCSDKLDENFVQPQDETTDGFVAFKINNIGNETRATSIKGGSDGGYNAGTDKEYAIITEQGANAAFFFRSNGSFVDKSYLRLMSTTPTTDDHDGNYKEGEEEKVYSAQIKTSTLNEEKYYCVLILNAAPADIEALDTSSFEKFMESKQTNGTLGLYTVLEDDNPVTYFTMSNTVYMSDGDENTLKGPHEITKTNICKTWKEAQEHKVTIHVERVVAKFGMTFKTTSTATSNNIFTKNNNTIVYGETDEKEKLTVQTSNGTGLSKWGIRINGWALNGTETATYWVKNLNDGTNINANTTDIGAWRFSTKQFGKWGDIYDGSNNFGWNDPSRMRSYWAVDPHYNASTDIYPLQYRKADNANLVYGSEGATENGLKEGLALNYISYKDIEDGISAESYKYAPENTFGDYSSSYGSWWGNDTGANDYQFTGNGYRWTGTHILVAAQLLLGDTEINGTNKDNIGDKYCYAGVYWTAEEAKGTGAGDTDALINHMAKGLTDFMSIRLYKEDGTEFNPETEGKDYFELIDATIKGGDGRQMLSLQTNKKLYTAASHTDDSDATTTLKSAIQEAGTVQHFSKGKMYYAIPIEHMVKYQKDSDDSSNNKFNIGSFGVVRNHWYTVNVSAIKKPGIPVDDPEEPIVPNDDPKEPSYVAFEIVVIPWHLISQDVTFE